MDLTQRAATPDDVSRIQKITYEAIAWNPDKQVPPLEGIVDHPEFARYHREWGRVGDAGVLTLVDGEVVAGAFYRLFTDDDHGHGYIDHTVPEIAIAVWGAPKGMGIGSSLMDALHSTARDAGYAQLSLSVDKDNPAVRLYERHGYTHHSADRGSLRMIRDV